jgi:energy-coupling factor transporter ATP-binding protein EcfA2
VEVQTAQLSLRVGEMGADRGVIIGRAGSGKSTLAASLIEQFHHDYSLGARDREHMGRVLVIDTKPRWRGEKFATGASTRKLYKGFVKGDKLRNSVVMTHEDQWGMAFDPSINDRLVIAQRMDLSEAQTVMWHVGLIERFFATQDSRFPSLLYIDEGLDFFSSTGTGRYSSAVQRCFRAGREKGLASLIGVQRPKTIPIQILTESNTAYLFALNYTEDVNRLREMGWPKGVLPPLENHKFLFYRDGKLFNRYLKVAKAA